MKKLIVGCGYLGRRVASVWLDQGHDVVAVTRSKERSREFAAKGISPIIADVTQPESLGNLPRDADTVLFAVGYDRSAGPSQRDVYVTGLENVLKRIANIAGHFIQISSTSVYGKSDGGQVDETTPCEPVTDSGKVCLEAEQTVWRYFPDSQGGRKSRANVLRLSGIYGPGRLLRRVDQLTSGEPLSGNPEAMLNLVHVDDAVTAVLACEERGQSGETYLISDDRPISRRDYYALLARLVGAPPPVFVDSPKETGRTPGRNKVCVNRRMHDQLHVQLKYPSINEGLKHAVLASH